MDISGVRMAGHEGIRNEMSLDCFCLPLRTELVPEFKTGFVQISLCLATQSSLIAMTVETEPQPFFTSQVCAFST